MITVKCHKSLFQDDLHRNGTRAAGKEADHGRKTPSRIYIGKTLLETCGIVLNRNVVPRDAEKPGQVSGLRLGTGAVTARGMGKSEVMQIAAWIDQVLKQPENTAVHEQVRDAVRQMCDRFPVYANGHSPLADRA